MPVGAQPHRVPSDPPPQTDTSAPGESAPGPRRGAIGGSASAPTGADAGKGFLARHRRAAVSLLLGAAAVGFAYYVVPQIAGLGPTLKRLRGGNPWWLALGVPLETLSFVGYVALFHCVFSEATDTIGWRASTQITMAGDAATKIFATAGAGGLALTVWALRAAGLSPASTGQRMVCFEVLNYAVYMGALVIAGLGLWTGLFAGSAPAGLTLAPALFGAVVILVAISMLWLADPAERFLAARQAKAGKRAARWWGRAASYPRALRDGLRSALEVLRGRDRSCLGAIPAWGFDIAVLWASFRAFGAAPPAAVLIMGYYVGTLGNTLPLPGGIGGVEGGMIGAFLAFGVDGSLAVLAVLAYRTISYWLPTVPGGIGYVRLRHTVAHWHAASPAPDGPTAPPPGEPHPTTAVSR